MNTLLSSMNLKPVNRSMLKKREREAGLYIERVAKGSCIEAATEEKDLILAEQSTVDCDTVPVRMKCNASREVKVIIAARELIEHSKEETCHRIACFFLII